MDVRNSVRTSDYGAKGGTDYALKAVLLVVGKYMLTGVGFFC